MTRAASKPRKATGWTAERRAKHAAAIRRWAPWRKSTGPRTPAGKAASARNAYKHGNRAAPLRAVTAALRAHSRFLRLVNLYVTLGKTNPPNELLDLLEKSLLLSGRIAWHRLVNALKDDIRDTYRHKLDLIRSSGTLPEQYV